MSSSKARRMTRQVCAPEVRRYVGPLSPDLSLCRSRSRNGLSPCGRLPRASNFVTLRKGACASPTSTSSLDHQRFFLYPTFDHQRADCVRESHQPELRRALEEGVGRTASRPPTRWHRRRDRPARPRAHPRVGRGRRRLDDMRSGARSTRSRPSTCGHDYAEKRPGVEAPPSAARPPAADVPHPAPGDGQGATTSYGGCRRARDHARPALRGHAGPLRRESSAPLRRSPRSPSPTGSRPTPDMPAAPMPRG